MAAISFGVVVVLGKSLLDSGMTVVTVLIFRYGLAAVILLPVLAILGRPLAPARGEFAWTLFIGGVGYSVETSLFFLALDHGTAPTVTLLFFTFPVYVALATWMIGRGRPKRILIAGLVCAVAGGLIVGLSAGSVDIDALGVVFVIASGLCYTAYLIGVETFLKRTNPLTTAMWVSLSVSVVMLGVGLAAGQVALPHVAQYWWSLIGIGAASAAAFVCIISGLQLIGPVRTSVIASGEPLAATVLAAIFLGETLTTGTALGGLLILVGAVLASISRAPVEPLGP
jgi:drug/metabolite transporter (DMT)-like permease